MPYLIEARNTIPSYCYIIVAAIALLAIYSIIRSAMPSGTGGVKNHISPESKLKIEEMRKAGYSEEDLQRIREIAVNPLNFKD